MKESPTLIDHLYRLSFRNEPVGGWLSNAAMRERLFAARRFVLDDRMSTYLAELSVPAFITKAKSVEKRRSMAESFRVQAKLPHKVTWIEYNLHKYEERASEILQRPFDRAQTAMHEGWLLEQHPQLETAFRLHIFSHDPTPDRHGFNYWTFPVVFTWTVDEQRSPWPSIMTKDSDPDSSIAAGILDYDSDAVTIARSDLLVPVENYDTKAIVGLLREWTGVLRRAWALLATINDIPVLHREVVQAKGFVAKGRYRKFLSHRTITLNVPIETDLRKVARQALAMARRRGHDVRGHHRIDWLHRPSALCEHEWQSEGAHLVCGVCHGRKLWIKDHRRGDASQGLVLSNYKVEHKCAST